MFPNERRMSVIQGTHSTSDESDVVLSAVLGSCIAVCAYDELAGVGGMNHILLPGTQNNNVPTQNALYGANLMELLLNNLFSKGAMKKRLKLKLFGGASLLGSSMNVGPSNVEFISRFVETEGLEVVSSSLGGGQGRQIEFHPVSGRSRQKFLVDAEAQKLPPVPAAPRIPAASKDAGEIELF